MLMDMFLLFELFEVINPPLGRIGVSVDCPNVGLPPHFTKLNRGSLMSLFDQVMSLEQFREHAKSNNIIPLHVKVFANSETPLTIYKKLAMGQEGTFLLESAENDGKWSRYSFVGLPAVATLREEGGIGTWSGNVPEGAPKGEKNLDAIRKTSTQLRSPRIEGLPPLTSGLVGYLGYDAVRILERIDNLAKDDLGLPMYEFLLCSDLAVFDHINNSLILIANAINWDGSDNRIEESYNETLERLKGIVKLLEKPVDVDIHYLETVADLPIVRRTEKADFITSVNEIKEDIFSGNAFQVVLSQRFEIENSVDPFLIYQALRMYFIKLSSGITIVGSSPEAMIKVDDRNAMVHPIAGTRPRSSSAEIDARLEAELLSDPKERAEHVMLIDLGRNDLARVSESGSVEVIELMKIEKYSHVMHMVSTVTSKLRKGVSSLDALLSVFPAGTLSGAPKPSAMNIIEKHESTRRGLYGGVIAYMDFHGNLDSCIAIRTALIKDGRAYVQAGAGIVADSVPELEEEETVSKAAAVIRAINLAHQMRDIK
jgi:anthranilate synthase component I